jgi:hypothetical protein
LVVAFESGGRERLLQPVNLVARQLDERRPLDDPRQSAKKRQHLLHAIVHVEDGRGVEGLDQFDSSLEDIFDLSYEERGFEPCMGLFLSSSHFVVGSLFGAGKPFFVPSPAIRFAERAEGVKGPKR